MRRADTSPAPAASPLGRASGAGGGRAGGTVVVALAGQPNVGKTTVFGLLTGQPGHVGNWPGKTVGTQEALARRGSLVMKIVDLPGTYSLTANSPEERTARDFVIRQQPDVVVLVADAASLERTLYLLAELVMLPVPVVVALNRMDVAGQIGIEIDCPALSAALHLPVVPLVARTGAGGDALMAAIEQAVQTPHSDGPSKPAVGAPHQPIYDQIRDLVADGVPAPYPPEWVALKLLEGDNEVMEAVHDWLPPSTAGRVATVLRAHEDAIADVAAGRYAWIDRMVHAAVRHPRPGRISITDRLDRIATHPRLGLLLLLSVLLLVFGTTFAITIPLQTWLDVTVVQGLADATRTALAGSPDWIGGLVVDGVIGGAGTVLTLLPILALFFVWMAALEESGYMARAAFVMDPLMHPLGLHGKSVLPMALGIGCTVPAIVGARIVEAPLARLLTALLAPFVPCAGRLAVVAFLAPIFFGVAAPFVAIGLVAFNLLALAVAGLILNRVARPRSELPLIMELPLYQWPSARAVWRSSWANTASFLKRAGTVIVAVSAALWILGTYPGPDPANTVLGVIGQALAPIGNLMGMDWQMVVALLAGLVAKENTVAALGVVYGPDMGGVGIAEFLRATVAPATALAFLVVGMLFIPCAATLAALFTETGRARWVAVSALSMLGASLIAGIVVYQVASLL